MMLANKPDNDPILKIVIFPSCNCGDFTLFELWKCFTREVEYISLSSLGFLRLMLIGYRSAIRA
jgi:hypothetical protein